MILIFLQRYTFFLKYENIWESLTTTNAKEGVKEKRRFTQRLASLNLLLDVVKLIVRRRFSESGAHCETSSQFIELEPAQTFLVQFVLELGQTDALFGELFNGKLTAAKLLF